jgi:HEPN domain-containing protein
MTVNPVEILKKARKWLAYAEEDLRLAKHGLTMSSSCPYRLIAYHAQQCAEKYLKAYLVFKRVDFPYTHNIRV